MSHSRKQPSRVLGLIEKNKVEVLGYRAKRNRENGMTPIATPPEKI
jgi:hypothetical protein